eukprot:Nitzschia sp. Nitz4//scaffold151_size53849//15645//16268//NITZ4_006717-RA/size53849-processed-gene-0.57-mRNA-1//1//CDS//3329537126//1136//frame0
MTMFPSVNDYSSVDELRKALKNYKWAPENLDKQTSEALDIDKEAERLMVLKSYNVLDTTTSDPIFEELANSAHIAFKVPVATVCLVDMGRLWLKSSVGIGNEHNFPRHGAMASHAVHRKKQSGLLVIKDCLLDNRFSTSSFVLDQDGPRFRFYAAAPIATPEGHIIGVLSIADHKPRPEGMTRAQESQMRDMAAMVVYNLILDADCQ